MAAPVAKGAAPVGRNSFACTDTRRMVFFGGCDDNDLKNSSEFFNDLHAYDMDLGRFFKLELRGNKAKRKKSKNKKRKNKVHGAADTTTVVIASDDESEEDELIEENKILDGYEELDDNKFYYVLDGVIMEMDLNDMSDEDEDDSNTDKKEKGANESTVAAEAENVETDTSTTKELGASENLVDEEEEEVPTLVKMISDDVKAENVLLQFDGDCNKPSPIAVDKTTAETPIVVDKTTVESTAKENSICLVDSAIPEKIAPRKRFNASICCLGSHLYVWGGMWEEKDRRFTLDDIWTLDMVKLK